MLMMQLIAVLETEKLKRQFTLVKESDKNLVLVAIEKRKYLIPSRTQKSSSSSPMVLYARVWESRSPPSFLSIDPG